MQNCNQLSQLQQLCCVCFFIEGKTDPMERQDIIMYTLTIKQINLSFFGKIVCAKTRMQGKLQYRQIFMIEHISDEIYVHMKHERIIQLQFITTKNKFCGLNLLYHIWQKLQFYFVIDFLGLKY